MKKRRYIGIRKKKMSIRDRIYMFVLIAGFINIFFPNVVHADILGTEAYEVYADITTEVVETNDLLEKAFKITTVSPYKVLDQLETNSTMATNVHSAANTLALAVATMLLMVDFFRKCTTFEFASRWENILIFLVKIIVLKQVIQNSDVIIGHVYALFDTINQKAVGGDISFLPCDDIIHYEYTTKKSLLQRMRMPWWENALDLITGDNDEVIKFDVSKKAVQMFYPTADTPTTAAISKLDGFVEPSKTFHPTFAKIFLFPYFLVMKAIAYYIFVIVVGRTFELCIYTILAPLPLCTFASETTHDIAKNFLKSYIAVVLQITVIVTMFITYVALNDVFTKDTTVSQLVANTRLINLVVLLALALGIHKSGEWSKRICGAS